MDPIQMAQTVVVVAVPLVFAVTLHEVAHGWVARHFGDRTAESMGRLTANPIPHIDPVGTVAVPALLLISGAPFLFGWAKPVPVDFRNLRRPRRDMALVAAAGPAANVLMALFWGVMIHVGRVLGDVVPVAGEGLVAMASFGVLINVVLAAFNMLPVPPLDGSRVVVAGLSPRIAHSYLQLERWGFLIIVLLLVTGILGPILRPAIIFLRDLVLTVTGVA